MIQPLAGALAPLGRAAGLAPWYQAGGAPVPLIAYQPKGAASLAASYVNLANPGTYDAALGTAPTFAAATGWTFTAASSQYLTTGYTPTGKFNPQVLTVLVRVSNSTANSAATGALNVSSNGFRIMPVRSNNADAIINNGAQTIVVGGKVTSGVIGVAGGNIYANGVDVGDVGALEAASTPAIYVGGVNLNGTPGYFNGGILAFVLYESALSAPQVAAVSAAMAAL